MTEQVLNTGVMPDTDFRYEEFEGLLGSYYLSLLPLKEGGEPDQADFEAVVGILNGFAERHGVQLPEKAAVQPRPTIEPWGQPEVFGSCFTVVDMMGSFWRDFGVGMKNDSVDGQERLKLGRLVLGVLERHRAIEAVHEEIDGKQVAIGVKTQTPKFESSLSAVLQS